MKYIRSRLGRLSSIQILSAIIWATTIIACSTVDDRTAISAILITAAGFHVVLLSQLSKPSLDQPN